MKNKYKILIFEAHDYHEEVIIPQIEFLLDSKLFDIYLVINKNIKYKSINSFLSNKIKLKYIIPNKVGKIFQMFELVKFINNEKFDIIIFNSLEDKYVKLLNKFVFAKKKIAIVHNMEKFLSNKLDFNHFFVLSDHLLRYAKKFYKNYNFESFYPLIYNLRSDDSNSEIVNNNNILICIPGSVELVRRDYIGLLELIDNNLLKDNIKFIILGNISENDGPLVLKKIREKNLIDRFILFDKFVPYDVFFSFLKKSDVIMPLIHPNVINYKKYKCSKISASFNMAFSFKKPLLMFEEFKDIEEFSSFGIFYNFDNFISVLNNLDRPYLKKLYNNISFCRKFDFNYQKNKYINFLIRDLYF